MRSLRILLQAILFFLLLGSVIAIGAPETGVLEKLVLVALCRRFDLARGAGPPARRPAGQRST